MKKILLIFIVLVLLGCTNKNNEDDLGIRPYTLNEDEQRIFEILNVYEKYQFVDLKVPITVDKVIVDFQKLNQNNNWEVYDSIELNLDRINNREFIEGTFFMKLNDNYSFYINIFNNDHKPNGKVYTTKELDLDYKNNGFLYVPLEIKKNVEYNKQIPICIMVYTEQSSLEAASTDYFYNPTKFDYHGVYLVQAITMKFIEK